MDIIQSGVLKNITSFGIPFYLPSSQGSGNDLAQAVASYEGFKNLTELKLKACFIGDEGARALATSPYLKNVRILDLRENYEITSEGARLIRESPNFHNAQILIN